MSIAITETVSLPSFTLSDEETAAPVIVSGVPAILQCLTDELVAQMDYAIALTATVEKGGELTIRAYAPKSVAQQPLLVTLGLAKEQDRPPSPLQLDHRRYRYNLGVLSLNDGASVPPQPQTSASLYDLIRPFTDKKTADHLQADLGVAEAIAIPLFNHEGEAEGSLMLATRHRLSEDELNLLTTLGQQTAVALQKQRRVDDMAALERVVLGVQAEMTDETKVLQTIVDAVVEELDYAGAMVATLESGNALPVRAYAFDVGQELIRQFEKRVGIDLIGPDAVVYIDQDKYKNNLSVRAVNGLKGRPERYLISDQLYDLLRPIVNRPLSAIIQRVLGIKQVVAVPFFLKEQLVGNLFVASRKTSFTEHELRLLTSFGQQAAVGLRNARLYKVAEEQRQIAEMFGRMAFSATTSIHKMRNHVGAVRTYMHLLQMLPQIPADTHEEILSDLPIITERLDKLANVLDSLHQPWRQIPDEPVNVNHCLVRALNDVFPLTSFKPTQTEVKTEDDIIVHLNLTHDMPMIESTPDMLAEAFRILVKNAVEAMEGQDHVTLSVSSNWQSRDTIMVRIEDTGTGIAAHNLTKIFELGWSTKGGQGMGFGLFWTKDYVEGLGGTITAESELSKGTTFLITLPASVSWETA